MKLEEEAKKFMKERKITSSKKLEEILENLKLINSLAEITFKKFLIRFVLDLESVSDLDLDVV